MKKTAYMLVGETNFGIAAPKQIYDTLQEARVRRDYRLYEYPTMPRLEITPVHYDDSLFIDDETQVQQ